MNWTNLVHPALFGLALGLALRYVIVPALRRRLGRVVADAEKLKARLARHHLGCRLAWAPSDAIWTRWYGEVQEELGFIDEDDRVLLCGFIAQTEGETQLLLVQNGDFRVVAFPLRRTACERLAHYLSHGEDEFGRMAEEELAERAASGGFTTDTSESTGLSAEFTTRGIGLRNACELGLVEDRRDALSIGSRQRAKWELEIRALLGRKKDRLLLILSGFHRYVDRRQRYKRVSVALSVSGRNLLREAVAKVLDDSPQPKTDSRST